MPRIVDPAQRRQDLADAVWRVVRRDGLAAASVREVAREAGLSTGSLRHYFASQSELRLFAMQHVVDRIRRRVESVGIPGDGTTLPADPGEATVRVLSELLPLDAGRQAENEVWLAFTAAAQTDAALRPLRDEAYDQLRQVCGASVGQLLGPTATADRTTVETERLFAVLDGLAVHAAMRPDRATPAVLRSVLQLHVDQLGHGSPAG